MGTPKVDPAGLVNLERLDQISEIDARKEEVIKNATPSIATIMASVISFEATVTAWSAIVDC